MSLASRLRRLRLHFFVIVVAAVLLMSACASEPQVRPEAHDDGDAPELNQPGTDLLEQGTEIPPGFDYKLEFSDRTFDPDREYLDLQVLTDASVEDRFLTSDAVLVVDIAEVAEPALNSNDQVWWSPPHSEDSSLIRPAVGTDVTAEVVGVLKARQATTTFGLKPDAPDLSTVGSPHPARVVPATPAAGSVLTIWVEGGIASVHVTAEEWKKYLDDWGGEGSQHVHSAEQPLVEQEIPQVFQLEVGGRPNMDLAEGGRYVVFLRAVEVPQREGSVRTTWTGDYDTTRSQLLVDPTTRVFSEPGGDLVVSVDELLEALTSASASDAEPKSYHADEVTRLFG